MTNKLRTILYTGIAAAVLACEPHDGLRDLQPMDDSPVFRELPQGRENAAGRAAADEYSILAAEYITAAESGQIGRTVFFSNVGNKQLSADFVPALALDGTSNISYYIDETRPSADLPAAATTAAITRAMSTWDGLACSEPGIFKVPSVPGVRTGFVSRLFGFGGSFRYFADVVHAGWMPGAFFDSLATGGSSFILGVTFTIIFTGSDADNDGKADVAWREIYYNDNFPWAVGAHYDVETIALHEAGHGLSQAHFGKAFITHSNIKIHFAPRAVMNAAYSGIQTELTGTDNGGHCSNWGSWPMQ